MAEAPLVFAAAMVVGASLGTSGAVLQSVLRNPLAEPYLLGMVGGGALLASVAVVTGAAEKAQWIMPAASLLGSVLALALVGAVAWSSARAKSRMGADAFTRTSHSTVVLAGFVVGGTCGSLEMLVISLGDNDALATVSKWLYGSLAHVTAPALAGTCAAFAVSAALLWSVRRELNVMELGHDEAALLGVNVRRAAVLATCAAALATSAAVALAGAVGFVGLVVPHLVRRLSGPRMQTLLPLSALAGGVFVALGEGLVRILPGEVGVGVACAVMGGPAILVLLATRHRDAGRDV